MTKYIEWLEPYSNEDSVDCLVRVTVGDAITLQRNQHFRKGLVYDSEDKILDDFITVRWASIVEY